MNFVSFYLDLVATAKNVYSGMITAGSKANQTHKMVEVRLFRFSSVVFLFVFFYVRILNIVFLANKILQMMFKYFIFLFVNSNKLGFSSYEYFKILS
jgi:hypothetical protein